MSLRNNVKILARNLGVQVFLMRIKETLILENESFDIIKKRELFYRHFIEENDTVFDVGANLGNRTEIFLNLGAKVVAIEPNPDLVKKLNKKYANKIIVESCGIGSRSGIEVLNIASISTISSFSDKHIISMQKGRFSEFSWNGKSLCRIKTLDSLISIYGVPDFIKVDVEGFEAEVLKGLNHKIKCISLEYNVPDNLDILVHCINEARRINEKSKFNYSVADSMELSLDTWVNYDDLMSLIESNDFIETSWGDLYVKLC